MKEKVCLYAFFKLERQPDDHSIIPTIRRRHFAKHPNPRLRQRHTEAYEWSGWVKSDTPFYWELFLKFPWVDLEQRLRQAMGLTSQPPKIPPAAVGQVRITDAMRQDAARWQLRYSPPAES